MVVRGNLKGYEQTALSEVSGRHDETSTSGEDGGDTLKSNTNA